MTDLFLPLSWYQLEYGEHPAGVVLNIDKRFINKLKLIHTKLKTTRVDFNHISLRLDEVWHWIADSEGAPNKEKVLTPAEVAVLNPFESNMDCIHLFHHGAFYITAYSPTDDGRFESQDISIKELERYLNA